MAKRGSNIYRRKDGRYEGRVIVGRKADGKYQYKYVYDRTLSGVKKKLEDLKEKGQFHKSCTLTVTDIIYLWLEDNKESWKATTYAAYRQLAENAIIPCIGGVQAKKVDETTIDLLFRTLRERSDSNISPNYQKHVCMLLRQAFFYVKRTNKYEIEVPDFPTFHTKTPAKQLPGEEAFDKLDGYLREHASEDTCLGILLAKYTGIRIGELCALRWQDIDLEAGILLINGNLQRVKTYKEAAATEVLRQTPKTEKSARVMPIPNSILPLMKAYAQEPGRYLIAGYKRPWAEARTVQYRFSAILKKLGIPQFNFHMLRHFFASTCIQRGCDMKSLSEMLGHSSIQITMNLYVHVTLEQKREALNTVFSDF